MFRPIFEPLDARDADNKDKFEIVYNPQDNNTKVRSKE